MLHTGGKPRYFEIQDRSATEPCSKRIKSAEALDDKSYDGLQRLHEEVHIKKTHSGFIPLSLSDDYDDETTKQEEKDTGEVLDPFNTATVDKISKSSNSLSNIEVTGSNCPLSTVTAPVEKERKGLVPKNNSKGDSALYSTSKVFIGPIYKNEANHQHNEKNKSIGHSCQNMSNKTLGGRSEKMPQQALHCHVPKIEDELSLFYSEIDQLESNENCLDGHLQETETNSHGQPAEYNKLNQPFPVHSQEWSSRIPPSWNNGPCSYTNSGGHNMGDEQYGSSDPTFYRSRNEQCYNNQKAIWEIEQLCHKEEGSRFWNNSVPEFVPSQQRAHPFITPYGPPPPQFTTHLNLRVPNSSSFHSATFSPPNVGPFKNVPINMNRSASQNNEYISHFDNYCAQTSKNGCNVPDRHVVNGFCETPTNWKDKTCRTEGFSTDSQWFSKNRLCESQKLLIILRGLPGAGKTTLSHVLLGHSRDGIIFSTDDYFCENNGRWSYNIAQLGAAHDWNQKRAKQAMDEGRSPIIIDNTNTQAWEMKPYVEAALEKGYQVEFHEPDTWWKFIPEELEKRNKHGVSLEKIAQMLERYEYHMSIPIVMNSLLPFHKTSPRPPPERRQRQSVAKKQDKFYKMKQRRKRRRNKKSKSMATKVIEKNSGGDWSLSDEESSQSGPEGLEDDGKSGFATGHLNEHKEESKDGFARDIGLKHSKLQKGAFLDSNMMDPVTSGNSVNTNVLVRNSDLCLMSLSPATDGNVTEQSFRHSLPNIAQSLNSRGNESSVLEFNNQSALKLNHRGTDNGNTARRTEDEDKAAGVMVERGVESNLLSNKEEVIVLQQHGISQNTKINTWAFFSIDLVEKQQQVNSDKNECLIWPEDISLIIHEQRLKKVRSSKQIFPETKRELIDYKSRQKLVECADGEMLLEKNVVRGYAGPSLLMEDTCNMSCIAVGDLTESRTKASVPSDVTKLASSRIKERCKRIFKLAPNFDIPRQVPVKNDGMIKDVDVLVEQQGILNKGTKEKKKNLNCYGYSASSTYDKVMVQMSKSASCKTSLPGEQQIVPFNQTIETNTGGRQDKISPDVSTTQPDVLSSVKEIAGCLIDSTMETLGNLQQFNQTEQTVYPQIRDNQNPLSSTSKFWRLPLSLRFAVQLVERFGSPGVPLDTLLPDDYVVPLDWATSKQMYLHWKTSVEKKQRNSISKEDSALPACVTILEDSNKEGQERQEPYEVNLQKVLEETSLL